MLKAISEHAAMYLIEHKQACWAANPVVAQPVVAYNPTPSMIEMRAEFDALYQRAVRAEPAITTKLQDSATRSTSR